MPDPFFKAGKPFNWGGDGISEKLFSSKLLVQRICDCFPGSFLEKKFFIFSVITNF